jgi:glycosyltransferase involved in cell wall biosynthesis/SAM-dependent methyltransferase
MTKFFGRDARCADDQPMTDDRVSVSPEPRVAIAVPCFKQEVFLFECLNSLVAQTMPSWQAFVVDDCSPIAAADRIVSSYGDPRICYIRHDVNSGLSASRNTGLQAGHAQFVLCIDADDFLHPDFLSATLEAIEKQHADCAYTEFQCVGVSNYLWFTQEPKSAGDLAREQWLPGPGVTMRRSVWEAVGGYSTDLRYNEDLDFWIAALQRGVSVARVPRPLYFYRRHGHSMTATQPENERITREVILKRHAAFFAGGDRVRQFRAAGLVAAAYAHRDLGHRWQSIVLTARAISVDPELFFPETKTAVRRFARKIKRNVRATIRRAGQILVSTSNKQINLPPLDWDTQAPIIHNLYGHRSQDYPVLGCVIDKITARSVLEIGCGSGRLVPVYLTHNVQTIWLQDVSERALDLCRQRFFCQKQIRYIHGNMQSIPISAAPDLIVANRVLQHILDEGQFNDIMSYLTSMARYFYVNEAGIEEAISINWPYLKGRDYIQIFRDLGWHLADRGGLTAEDGTRQTWMLFATENKVGDPAPSVQQVGTLEMQHPE